MTEQDIRGLIAGISADRRIVRIWLLSDDMIALNAWCHRNMQPSRCHRTGVVRSSRSRLCGVPITLCYGPYSRAVWSDGSAVRVC